MAADPAELKRARERCQFASVGKPSEPGLTSIEASTTGTRQLLCPRRHLTTTSEVPMGRERSGLLWPIRKKAIDTLRDTGLYGLANEAKVRARAATRQAPLPEIRFHIFGQGRTGSRLLCDLLHSHPDITCDLEILAERARDPRGLIEAHARLCKTRAHGFKHKIYQLTERQRVDDPAAFLQALHNDGWKMLHLSRRNVIRHALSGIARERTGVTHKLGGKDSGSFQKLYIEVEELRGWVEDRKQRQQREMDAIGDLPRLEIVYDDDLMSGEAQAAACARVVEWLGLPPAEMSAKIRPNTPKRLRDFVENFDEIAEAFEGTDEAQFFAEG